jgi:hypothetical protein
MGSSSVGFDGGGCSHARNRITLGTRPEQAVFGLDAGDGAAWREVTTSRPDARARTPLVAEAA